MTTASESIERAHAEHETPAQPGSAGSGMIKTLLKNPGVLKKLWAMDPDEKRYVRPPREYELPPFREDMKYCTSDEKYLRPTRWCNPREPEVIALANELGAYALSDYEFAEAAFWFIKTKLLAEMLPINSVGVTLRRGTGTCIHLTSAFIALCRAAGIKARYKTFRMHLSPTMLSQVQTEGEAATGSVLNSGVPEGEAEVCIDGKWVVGHVAMRPELFAVSGLPIPKFGEDPIDLTFDLIPGTVKRFEEIPLTQGIELRVFMTLLPAAMERASVLIVDKCSMGRRVIEEAGGRE
ncbi:MAG: transglutaminase family protein, partial [Euryarchaeota archaeon]|nr:transglutaminase family protein [Euryarchaeota archaeon]